MNKVERYIDQLSQRELELYAQVSPLGQAALGKCAVFGWEDTDTHDIIDHYICVPLNGHNPLPSQDQVTEAEQFIKVVFDKSDEQIVFLGRLSNKTVDDLIRRRRED